METCERLIEAWRCLGGGSGWRWRDAQAGSPSKKVGKPAALPTKWQQLFQKKVGLRHPASLMVMLLRRSISLVGALTAFILVACVGVAFIELQAGDADVDHSRNLAVRLRWHGRKRWLRKHHSVWPLRLPHGVLLLPWVTS